MSLEIRPLARYAKKVHYRAAISSFNLDLHSQWSPGPGGYNAAEGLILRDIARYCSFLKALTKSKENLLPISFRSQREQRREQYIKGLIVLSQYILKKIKNLYLFSPFWCTNNIFASCITVLG